MPISEINYTMNTPDFQNSRMNKPPIGKARFSVVLRASKDFVSINTTIHALGVDRSEAARLLSRWTKSGLLQRVKRGLYVPVAPALFGAEQVVDEPWIMVPQLFSPGYIGGWSAAEYWGLTEQLFKSICVLTTKPIRKKSFELQGVTFIVKKIKKDKLFGLKSIWRSQTKISVSSPARTLIDMIDDPSIGGGIRHVNDCLILFLRESNNAQLELMNDAKKINNGAVFKRLGFLLSLIPEYKNLSDECLKQITQGNAKLDPSLKCDRLIKKWRLWVPSNWKKMMK